jgi:hypothetical protein
MHDPNNQMQAEAVSATRPPQFNESNCGYRCGWGCCEPDGGGGGDSESDSTPTLIGSGSGSEDEAMEGMVLREGYEAARSNDSRNNEVVHRDAGPVVAMHDFGESSELNQHVSASRVPMSPPQMNWDYDESESQYSLENQVGSESHSSAVSGQRSIGSTSPRGLDYIGVWTNESKPDRFPGYFSVTPLRLSAQFEHCRGPVAAHMVSRDYSALLDNFGREDWRARMPVHDWAGFPTC